MARKIGKIALTIVAVVMLVVAFAGVISNQGKRTNRVIDKVDLQRTDKYMADEVIRTWYGQIGLTNVEEFGTNNGKVSAIIHYKNTTNAKLTLAPSDLGTFMDDDFDYKIYGAEDKRELYEPGDTAEFRVYIQRKDGLKGLTYLISEPERVSSNTEMNDVVYQSSVDLNMLNTNIEEKKELYGMSDTYKEDVSEDAVGRNPEHVAMMDTIDELILHTEEDEDATHAEEKRKQRLEQERQDALNQLNSSK